MPAPAEVGFVEYLGMRRDGVKQGQLPVEFLLQPGRPAERPGTLRTQVDRAQDVSEGSRRRRVFDVDTGPDRAIGVVQDFGGVGSENEAAERAVAVGRHRDQVDAFLVGEFDDFGCGLAVQHEPAHVESGERVEFEGVQFAFGLVRTRTVDIHQHGPGNLYSEFGVQRWQDVGEDELGAEVKGQIPGVVYRQGGAFGEIDGQEYFGKEFMIASLLG